MRRAIAAGLLLAIAAPAAPAEAAQAARWERPSVCVESHVAKRWAVVKLARQWNRSPAAPPLVVARRCAVAHVRVVAGGISQPRVLGQAQSWQSGDALREVVITVDPSKFSQYPRRDRGCLRRWTMAHELGHALGLAHYLHGRSRQAMSYDGSRRCGRPSAGDYADLAALYR